MATGRSRRFTTSPTPTSFMPSPMGHPPLSYRDLMATAWTLRTGSAEDLNLVEPLWVAVHHRHQESMPELAPYVSDAETWQARRKLYEEVLAKPDTLLVLALVDDEAVGYGLTHVFAMADTWIEDTWRTGDRIGEIESLSVLPEYRGSGLGTQLLERLEDH